MGTGVWIPRTHIKAGQTWQSPGMTALRRQRQELSKASQLFKTSWRSKLWIQRHPTSENKWRVTREDTQHQASACTCRHSIYTHIHACTHIHVNMNSYMMYNTYTHTKKEIKELPLVLLLRGRCASTLMDMKYKEWWPMMSRYKAEGA